MSTTYRCLLRLVLGVALTDVCLASSIISSPHVTAWGDWGNFEHCPSGSFAYAVQVKAERNQGGGGDDTALNGIRIKCTGGFDISSQVGWYGTWRSWQYCPSGWHFTGFELRSEANQGTDGDDTTANDIKFKCEPDNSSEQSVDLSAVSGLTWGDWTGWRFCPREYAICGIQTQVEPPQGSSEDDTSLNNVNFDCCWRG